MDLEPFRRLAAHRLRDAVGRGLDRGRVPSRQLLTLVDAGNVDAAPASGELSLPAGTTSRTVAVPILLLALANAEHGVLPTAAGVDTIVDADLPPTLSILDAAVTEGTGVEVSAVYSLELSDPSGREIRGNYATADGTTAMWRVLK